MKRIVYILEDNSSVREAPGMLIEEEPDLEVCGVASAAAEALAAFPLAAPALVLTDLSLRGMSGMELAEHLLIQNPRQRVAVLSGHPEPHYAEQARVAGYILKRDAEAMMEGIRHVLTEGV